jgi:hypothetical protein
MKVIVYSDSNGRTLIVWPAISVNDPAGFTDEQALERARGRLPADATDVREVEDSEIPTDRRFRDAWRNDFSVDMEKARDIQRQRIKTRGPLTPELEGRVAAATTPDELAAVEP